MSLLNSNPPWLISLGLMGYDLKIKKNSIFAFVFIWKCFWGILRKIITYELYNFSQKKCFVKGFSFFRFKWYIRKYLDAFWLSLYSLYIFKYGTKKVPIFTRKGHKNIFWRIFRLLCPSNESYSGPKEPIWSHFTFIDGDKNHHNIFQYIFFCVT